MTKRWNYRRAYVPTIEEDRIAKHGRNYIPFHDVTHRDIGDIPGITLAAREHTFVASTLAECQKITEKRANAYCEELMKYCRGQYGGNSGEKDMWSAVSRLPPIFGPHGEKL